MHVNSLDLKLKEDGSIHANGEELERIKEEKFVANTWLLAMD
jgi:hypothetical protein